MLRYTGPHRTITFKVGTKKVHILGFPNTAENPYRRYKLVVQRDCRLLGDTGSSGYSTNCMTEDGQSGGPVVAKSAFPSPAISG